MYSSNFGMFSIHYFSIKSERDGIVFNDKFIKIVYLNYT